MKSEVLIFRSATMPIAWRLAQNWCQQHGCIPISVTQEWAGRGCRRLRVESVTSECDTVFAQWSEADVKAKKSRGIPVIPRREMVKRDKAMDKATEADHWARRDFEIAMRSRYDGQSGPWVRTPWLNDDLLRGIKTAPLKVTTS